MGEGGGAARPRDLICTERASGGSSRAAGGSSKRRRSWRYAEKARSVSMFDRDSAGEHLGDMVK